jgi:tetratricopeptide (TPR) repeat protein
MDILQDFSKKTVCGIRTEKEPKKPLCKREKLELKILRCRKTKKQCGDKDIEAFKKLFFADPPDDNSERRNSFTVWMSIGHDHLERGIAQKDDGEYDKALDAYGQAETIYVDNKTPELYRSLIFYLTGRYAQSAESLRQSGTYYDKIEKSHTDLFIKVYKKFLKAEPKDADLRFCLAKIVYYNDVNKKEAVIILKKIIKDFPLSCNAEYAAEELARIYRFEGNKKASDRAMAKFRQIYNAREDARGIPSSGWDLTQKELREVLSAVQKADPDGEVADRNNFFTFTAFPWFTKYRHLLVEKTRSSPTYLNTGAAFWIRKQKKQGKVIWDVFRAGKADDTPQGLKKLGFNLTSRTAAAYARYFLLNTPNDSDTAWRMEESIGEENFFPSEPSPRRKKKIESLIRPAIVTEWTDAFLVDAVAFFDDLIYRLNLEINKKNGAVRIAGKKALLRKPLSGQ